MPSGTFGLPNERAILGKKQFTTALVTGGAGFIGSHLVDRLLSSGWKVTVLDNLSTGNEDNISHIESENFRLVRGSVTDREAVQDAVTDCDVVFHLAALADIVPSINDPMAYFEANVSGTATVMDVAKENGVKKIVYAASSSCYGLPHEFPTTERAEISPQYPYALTKWLGEEVVRHWGGVYQIPWVSLRLFNVFGPRSRTSGTYGAVLGVFLAQKLAGKEFTVVGDGEQSRDFTYVTDVTNAFQQAAESSIHGEVFNVGSGGTYSVNYLVSLLGGEKTHIPERPGEPRVTFADIRKISRVLQWKPEVSFEKGVENVLSQINYWKNAPVWKPETIEAATVDWFKYLGNQLQRD